MDAIQRIFIEVWIRLTSDWSRVTTFHQMGVLGEDAAREAIHRSNTYFVQQQLVSGTHRNWLNDPESFVRQGFDQKMPLAMTEQSVKDFRRTLRASALVFAHSILDAAVFDSVRICAMTVPDQRVDMIGNRKVSLAAVGKTSYGDLLRGAIDAELMRLERESLLSKVDRVFQICRPTKQEYLTNGFHFNLDRLTRLDDLRHKVIHSPGGDWGFESFHEDLDFMRNSGLHIFAVIAERFSLSVSGTDYKEVLSTRGSVV
jgi:hypothetical protein